MNWALVFDKCLHLCLDLLYDRIGKLHTWQNQFTIKSVIGTELHLDFCTVIKLAHSTDQQECHRTAIDDPTVL